jgi:hypothetical protein
VSRSIAAVPEDIYPASSERRAQIITGLLTMVSAQ